MGRPKIPLAIRFWNKVDKNGPIVRPELGPCWIWLGTKNKDGYGLVSHNKKSATTHRVSWELHNGPIPNKLQVLHRCDNPPCVNPAHLWLGTNGDNTRDAAQKGRHVAGQNRKVTENQVREIRARHAAGENRTNLGLEYGITKWAITDMVSRRSWSHVI